MAHPTNLRCAEFWDIGHKVFKSTPDSFPVKFLAGDAFDEGFLAPGPIVTEQQADAQPVDVSALTSLTPLHGRLSAIYASSFFHLFNEEKQRALAFRLASLLSPAPGSIIFGAHVGHTEKGTRTESLRTNAPAVSMFCHDPDSWRELWEEVFGRGKVEVQAMLKEVVVKHMLPDGMKANFLVWSVKRI